MPWKHAPSIPWRTDSPIARSRTSFRNATSSPRCGAGTRCRLRQVVQRDRDALPARGRRAGCRHLPQAPYAELQPVRHDRQRPGLRPRPVDASARSASRPPCRRRRRGKRQNRVGQIQTSRLSDARPPLLAAPGMFHSADGRSIHRLPRPNRGGIPLGSLRVRR
jgi:hypothetical protein